MIMIAKREPLSVRNPEHYKFGCIHSHLMVLVYGDVEPIDGHSKYRTAKQVAEECSLELMEKVRDEAASVPQRYREEHQGFDEKLNILEKAIQIKVE